MVRDRRGAILREDDDGGQRWISSADPTSRVGFLRVDQDENGIATPDPIAGAERNPFEHRGIVHKGAVVTVEVSDPPATLVRRQFSVSSTHRVVADGNRLR